MEAAGTEAYDERPDPWLREIESRVDGLLPHLLPPTAPFSKNGPDAEGRVWYVYGSRRAFIEATSVGFVIRLYADEHADGMPFAAFAPLSSAGPIAALLAVALTS